MNDDLLVDSKDKYKYTNYVADLPKEKLSSNEKLVYFILARNINSELGYAYPTQEQLMNQSGLCKDTLNKSLKALEIKGFIVRERGGKGRSTRYYFCKVFDKN